MKDIQSGFNRFVDQIKADCNVLAKINYKNLHKNYKALSRDKKVTDAFFRIAFIATAVVSAAMLPLTFAATVATKGVATPIFLANVGLFGASVFMVYWLQPKTLGDQINDGLQQAKEVISETFNGFDDN